MNVLRGYKTAMTGIVYCSTLWLLYHSLSAAAWRWRSRQLAKSPVFSRRAAGALGKLRRPTFEPYTRRGLESLCCANAQTAAAG